MFWDISGAAVTVGGLVDWASRNRTRQTRRNSVSDCVVHSVGIEYHAAPALFALISAETSFEHNAVSDVGYSAVSAICIQWCPPPPPPPF